VSKEPILIERDRIEPEARLQFYRNNAILALTEALKATFPAIYRLFDERFLIRRA
jgi:Putative DNA-binding domain